jgi:hypothetical protein
MPFKLHLQFDKGIMPRAGLLNKPLDVIVDGRKAMDIGWGQSVVLTIPAGNHSLSVSSKLANSPATPLFFDANDGETVRISCYLDVGGAGLTLVNENDTAVSKSTKKQTRQHASYLSSVVFVNLIGGVAFAAGVANLFSTVGLLGPKSNGIYWAILGVIFVILGYFVRKKSALALTLATLIYGFDSYLAVRSFLAIAVLVPSGNSEIVLPLVFWLFSVIFHIVFFFPMLKGIFTILALKRQEKDTGIQAGTPAP